MSMRLMASFLFLLCLLGCANQREPSGGPIDVLPPEIVSTAPAGNEVNVATDRIVIEFSEYVEQRSVEESIFISPSVGTLDFDWSGKTVEILLQDSLRQNTTYVVNIGTDVVDRRNRNRLAESFILAFSTGPTIDKGAIAGQIIPRNPADALSGVMIFAYRLEGRDPDTLDPKTSQPDYITQTGKDGSFLLQHVSTGAYHVLAVRDEFRNLLYDPEADDYGVPSANIALSENDTMRSNVIMVLAREDTTAPRLLRVDAIDRNHVGIQFSEAIQRELLMPDSLDIRDTTTGKPLAVIDVMMLAPGMTSFVLVTDDQDSTLTYRLIANGVRDSAGLIAQPPTNALRFAGAALRDTVATSIRQIAIADSARGVSLNPAIRVQFNDALRRTTTGGMLSLLNKIGRPVSFRAAMVDAAAIEFAPIEKLENAHWYSIKIIPDSVRDWADAAITDSLRTIWFETLDEEDFGSIDGTVKGWIPSNARSQLYVTYRSVSQKGSPVILIKADRSGAFKIPNVAGGEYILRAFEDQNGNGRYDSGKPFPRILSEPMGSVSDTLKVRSRWPLDGVVLPFR